MGRPRRLGRGSPPHTRGTPVFPFPLHDQTGITPAYAGNTRERLSLVLCLWDHPRIRGEHSDRPCTSKDFPGSPPHTRGTPLILEPFQKAMRITPAYAGNTPGEAEPGKCPKDHPRIRGEHVRISARSALSPGSPPHTRGTLQLKHHCVAHNRITPAYAGNTVSTIPVVPLSSDHPRIRGEH